MTLDDRIVKDLTDLYNKGEISDAIGLNGLIMPEVGQTSFAARTLPSYGGGKRDAKTVMVMLNPGKSVAEANKDYAIELQKRGMSNALEIDKYNDFNTNYGDWDKNRHDNFDLKQAFFLLHWKNTGVNLPQGLCAKSDAQTMLDAKQRVLMDKQQLELIPYASRSFKSFVKGKICLVFPYVETLFNEIFSKEREYVIFCAKKFEEVFKKYNKVYPGTIEFLGKSSQPIKNSKMRGSCSVIRINYNGKSICAIVANTFPSQALPNAYEKMADYGKFCYDTYCAYKNKKLP